MKAARYARAKELFEDALQLQSSERAAFLAQECKDDAALRDEVAELLRFHEEARGFLSGRVGAGADRTDRPMPNLEVPGYRIGRELGRGGMGVVYLAEQELPRRAVALKFLRLDSLSPSDVARFRREAEILGRLNHSGIAQVYGAGLTPTEQGELPWIAMEYVRGGPMRDHVAARALGLPGLVELFAELCDAVQHAHEKGVVHRDLKPSNVLVDERGRVRVLDFGVARLLGEGAIADGVKRTLTGQMVGTLAYASPEQASGRNREVDARSDVYSLGVILHELLTGGLPYAIDEERLLETMRVICDQEPRHLRKLRRDAPVDLETVLLKSLDKESSYRYANAGELAADLRRCLAEQPVAARAPSRLYRMRKFVRRNRALTLSTSAVIVALLATVGVLLVSGRREREQFERTRSMLDLMAHEVFRLVPELGFGKDYRGALEGLDARLAEELVLTPRDSALRGYRARSLYELGVLDQSAGDLAAAHRRFAEAGALREGLVAESSADLESRTHLSQVYARLGDLARLGKDLAGEQAWYQRAFELDQALVAEHPGDGELLEDLGWSLERMTDLAVKRGALDEAERFSSWRLADAARLVEAEPDNWKFLYNAAQAHVLAGSLASTRAPAEVESHEREVLRLARHMHELQPRRADFQFLWISANYQCSIRARNAGRPEEALPYAEVAFGMALQLLSSDPSSFRCADALRWTSSALFGLQIAGNLPLRAEETLARLRAGAGIAGEGTPNALLLLAAADSYESGFPVGQDLQETVLRDYQALILHPQTTGEMIGLVATLFRNLSEDVRREFCCRLRAADEVAARRFIEQLDSQLGVASSASIEGRPTSDH